jgi:hypothetical protein
VGDRHGYNPVVKPRRDLYVNRTVLADESDNRGSPGPPSSLGDILKEHDVITWLQPFGPL